MTASRRCDVVVVGGGPAGLYAAGDLARAGFRVALYEEHAEIGEPVHCTGIVGREICDEFDVPGDAILNGLTAARFHAPSGRCLEFATETPEALVLDRKRFDQGLARRAADAGVQIHRERRVQAIQIDADGVTVSIGDDAPGRGRACILACGARYIFQRRLGLGAPPIFLQTAQMEMAAECLQDVEVRFGAEVAPKGFAWAVPVRRGPRARVRVGVMADRRSPAYFRLMVDAVAPRWGVDRAHALTPRQKLLPLAPIGRTFTDRLLVVGDAAGLVKPTTGGGIYYSVMSGAIAADVLAGALDRGDLSAGALGQYEARWRDRLAAEIDAQVSLRTLAQQLTDREIDDLFELAETDGILPLIRRTARFNQHRDLIVALLRHQRARTILFRQLVQ